VAKTCHLCGIELKSVCDVKQYVESAFTGNCYCLPGEGCWRENDKTTETNEELKEMKDLAEIVVREVQNLSNLSVQPTAATSAPAQETSTTP